MNRDVRPMLASIYDPAKVRAYPVMTQPKLDGIRMLAFRDPTTDALRLVSRTGRPFDHLLARFAPALRGLAPGLVLDGELFAPDVGFQTIASWVKNRSSKVGAARDDDLGFWVFDAFEPARLSRPFRERLTMLRALQGPRIKIVETKPCKDERAVERALESSLRKGYEGLVVRDPEAPYEPGKRSAGLLKYKRFVDEEFVVVGVEEAEGKDAGSAVFVCRSHHGERRLFRVRPEGTLRARREMFHRRRSFVGKQLTVRYQELTDAGVPRFPVGVGIRDYE